MSTLIRRARNLSSVGILITRSISSLDQRSCGASKFQHAPPSDSGLAPSAECEAFCSLTSSRVPSRSGAVVVTTTVKRNSKNEIQDHGQKRKRLRHERHLQYLSFFSICCSGVFLLLARLSNTVSLIHANYWLTVVRSRGQSLGILLRFRARLSSLGRFQLHARHMN